MNTAGLKMIEAESVEQVKGQYVYPMVSAEHRKAFEEMTRDVFRGQSRTMEFKMVGLKGRPLWLFTHAVPLRDEQGAIVSSLAITTDITERKLAEEALRESEVRFRDLTESLPLTVFEMDLRGRFTYVNRAALEKFGYTWRDIEAGLSMPDVIAPEDRARARSMMTQRLAGSGTGYIEYQALRKDGTTFPITVASSPILRDGRPIGLRGVVADLTERRALEAERMKSEKLESVGLLAGGIAHDFNNLLQGIFGYISMAKMTIDKRERALAMLEQAEQALHRSVSLTSQLLTFSKGGKPVKKALVLPPVIENACRFSLSGSRSDCRIAAEDGLWAVEADEGQIAQVIQNIVLNAEQAMPLGGTIDVRMRNIAGGTAELPQGMGPGDAVEITIRDSGVGIPPEYVTKIFDPYFTTKEKGSGLGLATSYSIVRNHGGAILASSVQGKGSTFTVLLPASGRRPEAAGPAAVPRRVRSGRVLVMDDEDVVRRISMELLRSLGHEPEAAEHGDAALARYREALERGRPFDLVILDLTVRGGMGGLETLRRLREIDHGVRAVVSSGYSDDPVTSNYREHGFRSYLQKPYTAEGLNEVLNEVLSE